VPKSEDLHAALHRLYNGIKPALDQAVERMVEMRKAEGEAIAKAELAKSAPPGFSEKTMHELKRRHGVESAFKIAWAAYDKKHGRRPKHEKSEQVGSPMEPVEKNGDCAPGSTPGAAEGSGMPAAGDRMSMSEKRALKKGMDASPETGVGSMEATDMEKGTCAYCKAEVELTGQKKHHEERHPRDDGPYFMQKGRMCEGCGRGKELCKCGSMYQVSKSDEGPIGEPCSTCGSGELHLLGRLGNTTHVRCRNCGDQTSRIEKPATQPGAPAKERPEPRRGAQAIKGRHGKLSKALPGEMAHEGGLPTGGESLTGGRGGITQRELPAGGRSAAAEAAMAPPAPFAGAPGATMKMGKSEPNTIEDKRPAKGSLRPDDKKSKEVPNAEGSGGNARDLDGKKGAELAKAAPSMAIPKATAAPKLPGVKVPKPPAMGAGTPSAVAKPQPNLKSEPGDKGHRVKAMVLDREKSQVFSTRAAAEKFAESNRHRNPTIDEVDMDPNSGKIKSEPVKKSDGLPGQKSPGLPAARASAATFMDKLLKRKGSKKAAAPAAPGSEPLHFDKSERFEDVAFLSKAEDLAEPMKLLKAEGPEAVMELLVEGHQAGAGRATPESPVGAEDQKFEKGGYTLSWNEPKGYLGVTYDRAFKA
jgi:hypothetical protein